jgi:hypothetical protein
MRPGCLLIGAFAILVSSANAQVHDLKADWSESSNPNGAWAYREGSNPLGGTLAWNGLGQFAWANGANGPGHIPACMKLLTVPAAFDVQIGDVLVHCRDNTNGGANGEGNILWTAPSAGVVDMTGAFWIARDIGRSVNWIISVNGTAITGGTVASGDPYSRANPLLMSAGSGGPSVLQNIPINAGDTIGILTLKGSLSSFGDFIGIDWTITYQPPAAAAVPIGAGCGTLPYVPSLSVDAPVLGSFITFAVTNGTPNAAGGLYVSGVPAAPLPVGAGCTAYVDIPSLAELFLIATNASGSWSLMVQVPPSPPLAGFQFSLQAVLIPTAGPLGLDLTNGVHATIGY